MKIQRATRFPGGKLGRWETVADDKLPDPISSLHQEYFSLFKTGTLQVVHRRPEQEIRYRPAG